MTDSTLVTDSTPVTNSTQVTDRYRYLFDSRATIDRSPSAAEKDGFKRRDRDEFGMSTATKIVLTTVAASALLSILLVFQTVFI
ncbi:hypothetical protein SAMN04488556_0326 [Halostagnicola kamekurae]|uniref:Uncharacterized protein n=1 Tax=Halostagnicola kamekurae TaxID=619731 RepID=A0A1I6P4Y0_9EURY|nr:hypothetical protein SAMN04488556_0326 [Halostagnicola kamekurae]